MIDTDRNDDTTDISKKGFAWDVVAVVYTSLIDTNSNDDTTDISKKGFASDVGDVV